MSNPEYDVFLSHNSKDKPAVRALAKLLAENGIRKECGYGRRKEELEDAEKASVNWQQ